TCWEPIDRADERLGPRLRRADLAAGLRQAGFTDVEVRERPSWLAREHALWEEAAALDPGDDPALRSHHDEAVVSLQWATALRRVLAVARRNGRAPEGCPRSAHGKVGKVSVTGWVTTSLPLTTW